MEKRRSSALADPAWLHRHRSDPKVKLIEIAGMGQEEMQAYRAGHVPGAVCWPWKEMLWDSHRRDFPTPEEFARRCGAAGIGNDTTVVFYGEGVQFGVYAWWTFRYCGHRKVKVLDGARYRWAAEGRPLVTDAPAPAAPVSYAPVKRVERMRIHRDKVLAALRPDGPAILDGRSPEEYRGERVGGPGGPDVGAVRYGRIPGAKHLYFEELLDANKAFRPGGELEQRVAATGASRERDIIAYCRMSHRATVLYFALTELLGYRKVRIYDGSWTEWGNLVGVPVER
jgi:thiosulfate/3-mercaptopyruvate sulfurtransferase